MKPTASPITSRDRLLAAMSFQPVDHVPCSFMLFNGLKVNCRSYLEFLQRQMELGLDVFVQIPPRPPIVVNDSYNLHGLPVSYHPSVVIQEWKATDPGEKWPILYKEYCTPAGVLRAEVNQDPEWRWGDHVPFLDDYLETRSRKFLITNKEDLSALRYLLTPPTAEEIAVFQDESEMVIAFARQHDLLLAGGWGVGADLIGWVYGLQNMIYASYDQPDFLHELLEIIAEWNHFRMEEVLKAGVDLYIKRAWYENCDFWSPRTWREYLFPILKSDADLAHAWGVKFGYLITSNCMPLLDLFANSGVDVLIGMDPLFWDMREAKARLSGRVCLWGGVNGHLTVEKGTEEQVRQEVRTALEIFTSHSGFILSPVDNVREYSPHIQRNVKALIEEWQKAY